MTRRKFVPTIEGTTLESRLALSGIRAANVRNQGAPTDPGIPFVVAPAGVSQAAINFTTVRASQILHGNGRQPGIYRAFLIFNRTGDLGQLNSNLGRLVNQIPYGFVELGPTWQADIAGVTPATSSQAQQLVLQDYVDYLKANVGTTFNYLRSRGHGNEFNISTNGNV